MQIVFWFLLKQSEEEVALFRPMLLGVRRQLARERAPLRILFWVAGDDLVHVTEIKKTNRKAVRAWQKAGPSSWNIQKWKRVKQHEHLLA